mmetsp:Transcript_63234/g.193437  ORF Transcript_63234/g.193437 Transcript_63234/m.193437 type:complete len:221 (+) Transcript_63234:581-1243(+)
MRRAKRNRVFPFGGACGAAPAARAPAGATDSGGLRQRRRDRGADRLPLRASLGSAAGVLGGSERAVHAGRRGPLQRHSRWHRVPGDPGAPPSGQGQPGLCNLQGHRAKGAAQRDLAGHHGPAARLRGPRPPVRHLPPGAVPRVALGPPVALGGGAKRLGPRRHRREGRRARLLVPAEWRPRGVVLGREPHRRRWRQGRRKRPELAWVGLAQAVPARQLHR